MGQIEGAVLFSYWQGICMLAGLGFFVGRYGLTFKGLEMVMLLFAMLLLVPPVSAMALGNSRAGVSNVPRCRRVTDYLLKGIELLAVVCVLASFRDWRWCAAPAAVLCLVGAAIANAFTETSAETPLRATEIFARAQLCSLATAVVVFGLILRGPATSAVAFGFLPPTAILCVRLWIAYSGCSLLEIPLAASRRGVIASQRGARPMAEKAMRPLFMVTSASVGIATLELAYASVLVSLLWAQELPRWWPVVRALQRYVSPGVFLYGLAFALPVLLIFLAILLAVWRAFAKHKLTAHAT
jgi:hypothetical protein